MIYVISRNMEHFDNWVREQKLDYGLAKRIHSPRDAQYVAGNEGFVSLTPMENTRDEERIRTTLKARGCYELGHDINTWPIVEFA